MAMISAAELRAVLGADATLQKRVDSIHLACIARINRYAPGAPDAVATEALVLYAGWVYQTGAQARSVFPEDGPPVNVSSRAFLLIRRARAFVELAPTARGGVSINALAVGEFRTRRASVKLYRRGRVRDSAICQRRRRASGAGDRRLRKRSEPVRVRAGRVRGVGAVECHAGIDRDLARVGGVGAHS